MKSDGLHKKLLCLRINFQIFRVKAHYSLSLLPCHIICQTRLYRNCADIRLSLNKRHDILRIHSRELINRIDQSFLWRQLQICH